MNKETRRAAVLIRWFDHGDRTRWQATVKDAYGGSTRQFANRGDLMRFLWEWVYGITDVMNDGGSGADTGSGRSDS